jgi:hypothetical protein
VLTEVEPSVDHDMERHQLKLLRAELEIDPAPKTEAKEDRSRRRKTA